jgi:hypothetical protein
MENRGGGGGGVGFLCMTVLTTVLTKQYGFLLDISQAV